MNKFLALAAVPAFVLAAPASAIQVLGIDAPGPNEGTVFAAGSGFLAVDVAIYDTQPIVFMLQGEAADNGEVAYNSVADFFTGVTLGANVARLTLTLDNGATFSTIGSVEPAFSTAVTMLNPAGTMFTIDFEPAGEGASVFLGNVFGGTDFVITLPDTGAAFNLTYNAAVPELGTWAMMIAGFGLVGIAMRRRERAARA